MSNAELPKQWLPNSFLDSNPNKKSKKTWKSATYGHLE